MSQEEGAVPIHSEVKDALEDEIPCKRAKMTDHAKTVADHYNALENNGLERRFQSPIFYMRNFNNWIKAMQINEYLEVLKKEKDASASIRILDLCCGKGGDLLKWSIGKVNHLICTDIASVSIKDCESRYKQMQSKRDRQGSLFSAEFIVADCTNVRLREQYEQPAVPLDLVSCQFAFHYGFESLPQAECLLRNAAESLRPGGMFIGTIPDAYHIVSRLRKGNGKSFQNDIFKVELQFDPADGIPLFGAKYNFHLEGVVDCPEFLVHFPTFVELAKKYDLELESKERFEDYFEKSKVKGNDLMKKMHCFETYPPADGAELLSKTPGDYEHAKEAVKDQTTPNALVGTMSKSEWEAASIYLMFAFKKVSKEVNQESSA